MHQISMFTHRVRIQTLQTRSTELAMSLVDCVSDDQALLARSGAEHLHQQAIRPDFVTEPLLGELTCQGRP